MTVQLKLSYIYISATYNIHVRLTMVAKQVNKQKMKWVRLVKPTSKLTMTSLDQALYFSCPQCVCVMTGSQLFTRNKVCCTGPAIMQHIIANFEKKKHGGTSVPHKSTEGTLVCALSID